MNLLSYNFIICPETFNPSIVLEISCSLESLEDAISFNSKEEVASVYGARFLELIEEAKKNIKVEIDSSRPTKEDLKATKERHGL